MKKHFKKILATLLILVVVAFGFVGNYFYNFGLNPKVDKGAIVNQDSDGSKEDKTVLNLIEHSRYAIFHGKVSHDEIVKIQDNADFLLNFGNATPCAIPCKIFEYFSTGNPVISFLKIDDDASEPYVQRYPNSLIIDERKAIQENAELFVRFINSEHIADKEKIKKAFIDNAPETTVNKILKDFESCQKH